MRRRNVALAVVIVLSVVGRGAWGQYYYLRDLGRLSGTYSYAYCINASGQVAGYGDTGSSDEHAFLYGSGTMIDLGTLPGGALSYANGINASGNIVGMATTIDGYQHAFLYSSGTMTDLGTIDDGAGSAATGINAAGQVVGQTDIGNGEAHAFLYSSGTMTDLGVLPGGSLSVGYGINDSGQVVGMSSTDSSYNYANHAFLYSGGGSLTDLGTPFGGSVSEAYRINANGQIIGMATTSSGASLAFLYSGGSMTNLNTLGGTSSCAYGINNGINGSGQVQVVGASSISDGTNHAFLYTSGTMTDLNAHVNPALNWTLEVANAINDNEQIAGYGLNADGDEHAFLLSPMLQGDADGNGTCNGADLTSVLSHYNATVTRDYTGWTEGDFDGNGTVNGADLTAVLSHYNQVGVWASSAVPEPSTLLLAAVGLVGLIAYAWKRRKLQH